MSDYSFMKTGYNNNVAEQTSNIQIDVETIDILLTVFINNALQNAVKYSTMCKRNGVSREDIVYSLKYEVFEFLNQSDLMDKIEKARTEYFEDLAESKAHENDDSGEDDEDSDEGDILDNDGNPIVVPDDEIDDFKRIDNDLIQQQSEQDKIFINKIHNYFDNWNNWTPTDNIEIILKNAIDKVEI